MTPSATLPPFYLKRDRETHDRLELQSALYRDITLNAFRRAGLSPGMRVLDLGCGAGDSTFLAAEAVGPEGHVTGIDVQEEAVARARQRAEDGGPGNVAFLHAPLDAPPEGPFDALVGRFVLMHQDDAPAVLRAAAVSVRPGGLVIMAEANPESLLAGDHSLPHSRLYARYIRWLVAIAKAAGSDVRAGLRLRETFRAAGLPDPELHLEAPVGTHDDGRFCAYVCESARSLLPQALEWGYDDFTREEVERLSDDLREEGGRDGAVYVGWPLVTAWCRVPPE